MDRIWYKNYEEGIAKEIDSTQYNSLNELLELTCKEAPADIAFSNFGTEITFNQLLTECQAFAAYLSQVLHVQKGDRIVIMLPNLIQYPIALFGILFTGAVVVNVNPLYTAAELAHILNDSGAKIIIVLENFAHTLEKALLDLTSSEHKNIQVILTKLGNMFPPVKKQIANFVVKFIKNLVPKYNLPNSIDFNAAINQGRSLSFVSSANTRESFAFLQYTGGTTGISKGAILTHGNVLANVLQLIEWIKNIRSRCKKQIMVTPLPLYHIFSLTSNLLLGIAMQAKNILITNPRDITDLINELKKHKFTAITGVNTLFNALLNHPNIHQVDFSDAKLCIAGGMPAQAAVAERWQALTGHPLIEGYGLTEASPVVCANPLNIEIYQGSIGLPLPSTDVQICDELNHPVAIGVPGELCIKGPQVMQGYWNAPEETANVFTEDRWLKTGDIAIMDQEGYLFIVDRKKDLIIVSGFNVFPNEVEEAISRHPGVLEVAVIGVPNKKTGELVKAFVVKKDAQLSKVDILNTCKQYLTSYKLPRLIEFRDSLPKSPVGKILRRSLRE